MTLVDKETIDKAKEFIKSKGYETFGEGEVTDERLDFLFSMLNNCKVVIQEESESDKTEIYDKTELATKAFEKTEKELGYSICGDPLNIFLEGVKDAMKTIMDIRCTE